MRLVCQQPNYFPWLGYFEQIARANLFVYLDHVQWIRQGRQHRTRLPAPKGARDPFWLTVPVRGHGHRERAFHEIEVDHTQPWARRHWETLRALYGRAPYFSAQLEPLVRPFLEQAGRHRRLSELCQESVSLFWEPFGLNTALECSADLATEGKKSAMLLALCQRFQATEYYSALGASRYLDMALFREAGVRVHFQHFRRSAGDPLRPCDYSVLDWVARCSWDEIRACLGTQREDPSAENFTATQAAKPAAETVGLPPHER